MGTAIATQPSSPSINSYKSKIVMHPKQKIEEEFKPSITSVVIKKTQIPSGLSEKIIQDIQQLKNSSLIQFQNRFLLKVARNQIRLIFKQQAELSNLSLLSSNHNELSLKTLATKCFFDLQIYREICSMKLKCLVTVKLEQAGNQLKGEEEYIHFKQAIVNQFNRIIKLLIGEIEGKSSIWYSLNLTDKQKITNLINFLHNQGVNSSDFDILKQKESVLKQF